MKEYVLGSPYKKSIFFSGGTTEKKNVYFLELKEKKYGSHTEKERGLNNSYMCGII